MRIEVVSAVFENRGLEMVGLKAFLHTRKEPLLVGVSFHVEKGRCESQVG